MNTPRPTWKPVDVPTPGGRLQTRDIDALPESAFAFPGARKEPMTDPSHVRNAIARFNQVSGVSDADRDVAFANIRSAAEHFGVALSETDWRQLKTSKPGRG